MGFFGGRCEIVGNPYKGDKLYHFDFPNMYGNLLKEDLPLGNLEFKKGGIYKGEPGFYKCMIRQLKTMFPVLPYREEKISETGETLVNIYYPYGRFEGTYYSEELNFFLGLGGEILEIEYAYVFKDAEFKPIYKDYMKFLIKKRSAGSKQL